MRCYKCNSVLSDTDFCNGCGTDVTTYKKIVRLSNTYYNVGLEKAKVRDLSGAADYLRRSVRLDKNNINARNLLGLVYFEMGECVEAMSEWVISKNLQPEKNLADKYLSELQSNPTRLDVINQTAKKFNTALGYANEGSDDLAIVQLKRILTMSPNFVKGAQLLALLYMKTDEYEKAAKVLGKIEKIDKKNTLTIKYLEAIDNHLYKTTGKTVAKIKKREEPERQALSGDDVIIPQTGYREGNSAAVTIINVLIGIVLGAALVFFLVTPGRVKNVREEYNSKLSEMSAQNDSEGLNFAALEDKVEKLEKENAELKSTVESQLANIEKINAYDKLLSAASLYVAADYKNCAVQVSQIDITGITSEGFISAYNQLKAGSYGAAADSFYNEGKGYFDNKNYDKAIECLSTAYSFSKGDVRIPYTLAKAYRAKNGNKVDENAKKYFEIVIKDFPDSANAQHSKDYLGIE